MSHIFAFVPAQAGFTQSSGNLGARLLSLIKDVEDSRSCDEQWVHFTLAPRLRDESVPLARDAASSSWLSWTGVWIYEDDLVPALDGERLLRRYLEVGVDQIARELQGQFVLMIGDSRSQELIVVTDRCGSLHLFYTSVQGGMAVCTSSAVLSALHGSDSGDAHDRFDPVGLHEFVATGVIYEDRSLWSQVKKLGAGSVSRVSSQGICHGRYWRFADITPEKYSLDEAVELTMNGITRSVQQIARVFPRMVCDLTGGYDSRALLCGMLKARLDFETTVSGPAMSMDVQVSRHIAQLLSIRHTHNEILQPPTGQDLIRALCWTDGEYDIFDYARIAAVHTKLSRCHDISLNGSFGEIARGYWWELIWPKLTERAPLSGELLSRKRFAAVPYTTSVFSPSGEVDLHQHMTEALTRTLAEVRHFPKSAQMDALYYYQRMGRWQGRIVSCTNQIWSCLSPFCLPQVLVPILETQASARIRSRLIRTLLERHQPLLARIPLEHGYPPRPFTVFNCWQFLPLLGHYADLAAAKLAPKIYRRLGLPSGRPGQPIPPVRERYPALFEDGLLGVGLDQPLLLESGLFDEKTIKTWFSPDVAVGDGQLEQWRRMAGLELLLRKLRDVQLRRAPVSDSVLPNNPNTGL